MSGENQNKPRRILIAGASARAATQSAMRAGFDALAVDLFADVDLREIAECARIDKYPADFAAVFAESGLPLVFTGGLENYPAIVARAHSVLGNGPEVLKQTRDPFRWTPLLQSHGFETAAIHQADDRPASMDGWLIKNRSGAGGGHVRSTGDAETGDYFQQFVPGLPCSAVFVGSDEGCFFVGASYQLVAPVGDSQFNYWGSVGPVTLPDGLGETAQRIGEVLSSELRIRGLFGVDFILTDSGLIPVEINPRYTASVEVHEIGHEASLFGAHVAACESQAEFDWPDSDPHTRVAKVILYSQQDRIASDLLEHRQISPDCWLADIPDPGSSIPAGAPICTMLARGQSIHDCARLVTTHSNRLGLLTVQQAWRLQMQFDRL